MTFRFKGLHYEPFVSWAGLTNEELRAKGARRMVVDSKPGYPCRVSLSDAEIGERVLLINFEHQPAHSPYRASGPIFLREAALEAYDSGEVPPSVRSRMLSVRAYDSDAMIVEAVVVDGQEVEGVLERLFAREDTAYIHVHYAARGCYGALVERA